MITKILANEHQHFGHDEDQNVGEVQISKRMMRPLVTTMTNFLVYKSFLSFESLCLYPLPPLYKTR